MTPEELPEGTRVKLSEEGEDKFWASIEAKGSISEFAGKSDFTASEMYNWKNKEVFLPSGLANNVLDRPEEYIMEIKGEGRSVPMKPNFPLEFSDELLTRVALSVNVNHEGVPVYQTEERSLMERFVELLEEHSIPHSSYSRVLHEVRYPKYVQEIFEAISFERDLAAAVDEKGVVENGTILIEDRKIPVEEFDRKLYSRQKRLEIALALEDSETIAEIMSEEAEKVNSLL